MNMPDHRLAPQLFSNHSFDFVDAVVVTSDVGFGGWENRGESHN